LDDNLEVVPCSFWGRIYSWIFKRSDERIVNLALKFLSENKQQISASDAIAVLSRMRPLSKNPIAKGSVDALKLHFEGLPNQVNAAKKKIGLLRDAYKKRDPSEIKSTYIDVAIAQLNLRKEYAAGDLLREFNEVSLIDTDGFEAYMMLSSDDEADEIFLMEKPFCTLVMDQFKALIDQWISVEASPVRDQVKQNACLIIQKVLGDRKANPKMTDLIFEYLDKAIITDQNKNEFYRELYKHVTGGRIGDTCIESNSKLSDFNQFVKLRFPDNGGQELEISLAELRGMGGYFQIWVENRSKYTMDNTSILDEMTLEEFVILRKFLVNKDEVDLEDLPTRIRLHFLAERFCLSSITEACENAPFATVDDAITFARERELKVLDLSAFGNEVTNKHMKKIKALSAIRKLVMRSAEVTDAGVAHLKDLKELRELDLGECKRITDVGLAYIKDLKELRKLNLSWCDLITDAGLAYLKDLKELRKLDFMRCLRITDAGLAYVKDLRELKELDLSLCRRITDAGVAYLKDLKELRELDLRFCELITDVGLAYLKDLKELRKLKFSMSPRITDEGRQRFRGLRPDVILSF
jgi:hypothetical protein